MKKIFFLLFLISLISYSLIFLPFSKAQSAECDMSHVQSECNGTGAMGSGCSDLLKICEANIGKALQDSVNATTPLQSKLDDLSRQIKTIKNTLLNVEISLTEKKKAIVNGYKKLAEQKKLLDATIRDFYIKSYYNSPFMILLSVKSASEFTQILGYQRAAANKDKGIIETVAYSIQDLQKESAKLKIQEDNLTGLKINLDKQSADLDKIVSGAKSYQAKLSNQLATLNSIQQSILSARIAGLNIPLYAGSGGSCSSDLTNGKDPGFSPKFGFFTYGVPNRVGLNQYGAFGRAKAGKGYEEILRAYYNFDSIDNKSAQINVDGYGTYSLDDYVKRIYEVPDSWGDQGGQEALKAQFAQRNNAKFLNQIQKAETGKKR
jgi:peptidoglycan hydrolase CwlO-like protein